MKANLDITENQYFKIVIALLILSLVFIFGWLYCKEVTLHNISTQTLPISVNEIVKGLELIFHE